MDIVVTIPARYDINDKLVRYLSYWRMRRWPKKVEPGDNIYFVHHGEVRYTAKISDLQLGLPTEVDFEQLIELPEPRQKMKGFRGYRYYESPTKGGGE